MMQRYIYVLIYKTEYKVIYHKAATLETLRIRYQSITKRARKVLGPVVHIEGVVISL